MMKKLSYAKVGDDYYTKDPIKKLAQNKAKQTSKNLGKPGFSEVSDSRGESAFVWSQGNILMASVVEGLGTKNLVADQVRKITGKTYYDVVAHDTVATIVNDLVTVGAKPLVINAYWAIESNSWLADRERIRDLILGWKKACDLAGGVWGGGETPTLKGIIKPGTCDLGGSAVGIIETKSRMVTDKKLRYGDRILLLRSNGINSNGISLVRAVADKLPKGYSTRLKNGKIYGEAVLTKTNIYTRLIQSLLDSGIAIHYISNITGHGIRKIMRARKNYSYILESIFNPQEIFSFIQEKANLSDYEMYQTFNMGMDYAIFLAERDVLKAQNLIEKSGFKSIDAGFVEKGKRQVIIKPKNLIYPGSTLDLR